ncbi:MAG: metal ABC transporter ATP-binding protein [Rhodothermales bacterium]
MLHVNDITVRLGGRLILDSVRFRAERGDFVAILGPNGGGKSTLIRAILGLVPLVSGTIESETGNAVVGYVPQVKTLDRAFPATALELVASGRLGRWPLRLGKEDRRIAQAALEKVGAEKLASAPLARLSGGELQRVYLARAVACSPPLLILDEPEAGVDRAGALDLFDILETYRRQHQATIVMVTHDWDVAYHHASSVVLLNRRVVSSGAPGAALTDSAVREAFGHVGHAHDVVGGQHGH